MCVVLAFDRLRREMIGRLETFEQVASAHVAARRVDVWLPPAYEAQPGERFPVLYMHDGQNLFDPALAYGGVPWGVAEAMDRLAAASPFTPALIVGIWNTPQRRLEYLPQEPYAMNPGYPLPVWYDGYQGEAPCSDAYLRFVVTELKPMIDEMYRTRPRREHTFIMGSSMGGLISLYALCQYPHIFAGAGCVSTHWPAVEGVIEDYLHKALPTPGQHKIYFDYGTETLDALYEPYQLEIDALMRQKGYTAGQDWITHKFPGAEHSEKSWQERVHIPLQFLLGE